MALFFKLFKKSRNKTLPVLRTVLKGCQDSATINMSVCGDPSKKKKDKKEFLFILSPRDTLTSDDLSDSALCGLIHFICQDQSTLIRSKLQHLVQIQ